MKPRYKRKWSPVSAIQGRPKAKSGVLCGFRLFTCMVGHTPKRHLRLYPPGGDPTPQVAFSLFFFFFTTTYNNNNIHLLRNLNTTQP